jgi:mono/diheme cytochrome c family protein
MQRKTAIFFFIFPLILINSYPSAVVAPVAGGQLKENQENGQSEAQKKIKGAIQHKKNKSKGEILYTNLCASCHGISGIGNGPVASQLKTKPKDLTKLKQKMGDAFDTKVIKDRIDGRTMPRAHGIPEMPVWGEWFSIQSMSKGRLQEDQEGINKDVDKNLDALAEYILTLQK